MKQVRETLDRHGFEGEHGTLPLCFFVRSTHLTRHPAMSVTAERCTATRSLALTSLNNIQRQKNQILFRCRTHTHTHIHTLARARRAPYPVNSRVCRVRGLGWLQFQRGLVDYSGRPDLTEPLRSAVAAIFHMAGLSVQA